jgi:hypothetical protein
VPGVRAARPAETLAGVAPDPALFAVVCDPYDADVPYSMCHVVASPPGSTVPVTDAVVDPTAVVGPVVAVGAAASARPAKTVSATTKAAPATHDVRRTRIRRIPFLPLEGVREHP